MSDFCENCKYRQFLANAYDMHIDSSDCDKVNTHFCEKMRKQETVVIIDAGCTDKTMYHKGFKDGRESVEVVHGRWEKAEYHGFLRCDRCKDVYIPEEWMEDGKWNYCPNCGAKMDGDGNE